ncbi:Uncharacterised protein [uncultured archaeon]|nr:Uncharacterised protein [uncultured archaeon]
MRRDKDGKLCLLFVEAKSKGDEIRANQEIVLDALAEAGIRVYLVREGSQYANEHGGFLTVDWAERMNYGG